MHLPLLYSGVACTLLLCACSTYKSSPINLDAEASSWKQQSTSASASVTRSQAQQIGLVLNQELNKSRLKSAISKDVAKQSGWWNDPSFSWGLEKVLQESQLDLSGELTFTIPITGLPRLEKKLAEQYREADFWKVKQAESEFLSSLDQAWDTLAVTEKKKQLIQQRLTAIDNETEKIAKLSEAGEVEFTARQTANQRKNDAVQSFQSVCEEELEQTQALIKLLGLHPAAAKTLAFRNEIGLQLPQAVAAPTPGELVGAPEIKAQMAVYATTETALKTEIRKQYPELELGPAFTREEGEKKIGGNIGFNIPLWNRNRKAIAEARGERDVTRMETVQLWQELQTKVNGLTSMQQLLLKHGRDSQQRINAFSEALRKMEKLHEVGEVSILELSEARHQLYEQQISFLETLEKLLSIQARLRYIVSSNISF